MLFQYPNLTKYDEVSGYRQQSLPSICSKMLEKHVSHLITMYLKTHCPLSPNQLGVTAKKSTTTAMLSVLHDWHQQLEEKKEVCAAFFDLWKAFDTIPHLPLMHELQTLGADSYPLKWNHSYLTNRRQCVDKQKTMCCCGWRKIQCDPSQFWCATRLCSWTTIIILMECKVLQFPTALLYSMQMTWSCI